MLNSCNLKFPKIAFFEFFNKKNHSSVFNTVHHKLNSLFYTSLRIKKTAPGFRLGSESGSGLLNGMCRKLTQLDKAAGSGFLIGGRNAQNIRSRNQLLCIKPHGVFPAG